MRVFGSVARGEAGPGSDIDFLVDGGPGRSAFFPAELLADLGSDGLSRLQVPVKATNTELEVALIVQPVAPAGQDLGWPPRNVGPPPPPPVEQIAVRQGEPGSPSPSSVPAAGLRL